MIHQQVEHSLQEAYQFAQHEGHTFLTLEHLLFAIIQQPGGIEILQSCGANIEQLSDQLKNHLENQEVSEEPDSPEQTPAFQRVFQNALRHVAAAEKKELEIGDLLAAILQEDDSFAKYFLEKQGIVRLHILEAISQSETPDNSDTQEANTTPASSMLKKFATEYTAQENLQKDLPLIGRETEIKTIFEILCRKFRNNAVLLGDPGVGKTAIVKGLAALCNAGQTPNILKESRIFAVQIGPLLSGTRYRGDFEERLFGILRELKSIPNAILYLDEIHMLVGAGATGSSNMDASNILKPVLEENQIKIIGTTTHEEYQRSFGNDKALLRRFQTLTVDEPSPLETKKILKGLAQRLESHHRISYADSAFTSAIEYSSRYLKDSFLPDKAIDLLDHAGARHQLKDTANNTITKKHIRESISVIARVPLDSLSETNKLDFDQLYKDLKAKLFQQDIALETVLQSLRRHYAGLSQEDKPIGTFLLSGPTGVGKTEMAKLFAEHLAIPLLRFDMSEFSEQHSISRLLGAPPGYVGYGNGAQLTESIRKNPHCILLLDEIEKAHPVIYDALLQIMDHAKVTDQNGREADFQQVLLLMTTNAGSRNSSLAIGFDGENGSTNREIKTAFAPEFRNRLDEIILFQPLHKKSVKKVAKKQLMLVQRKLITRSVSLDWEPAVEDYLADKGFDPEMGARPMRRAVQTLIENPLADWLMNRGKVRSCFICFDHTNKEIYFAAKDSSSA